ncbi:MAG: hypothetical protein K2Q06_00110, partial [Parvularculaceae bacterium]|nr:hypothetical protein [Parvularculaceae bacterium]
TIERLAAQTGLGVGVFGMVGLNAQVFNWRAGVKTSKACSAAFGGGALERLNETAAGWLLLSTVAPPQRDGMLRRLNAEAPANRKFNPSDVCARVQESRSQGWAVGPAGYGANAQLAVSLLSLAGDDRPMALGIAFDAGDTVDTAALGQCLQEAVLRCLSENDPAASASIRPLVTAA